MTASRNLGRPLGTGPVVSAGPNTRNDAAGESELSYPGGRREREKAQGQTFRFAAATHGGALRACRPAPYPAAQTPKPGI